MTAAGRAAYTQATSPADRNHTLVAGSSTPAGTSYVTLNGFQGARPLAGESKEGGALFGRRRHALLGFGSYFPVCFLTTAFWASSATMAAAAADMPALLWATPGTV